ncbi:heavy metal-associated isoprenylated plant protein 20-like [Nymphaea colorata]|nr:heavy metal-associated isoprenylated plant protein 20-like [Nymphaea colorata]
MGVLDHLSKFCTVTSIRRRRKAMQTVELKVRLDCDGCERRVKHAVSSMKGVKSYDVIRKQNKVVVTGYVTAKKVMKRVRSVGKKAELWPYVQANLAFYPYAAGVYDKKAPAGFVRNVPQAAASPSDPHEKYASLFSDENPNACSIM